MREERRQQQAIPMQRRRSRRISVRSRFLSETAVSLSPRSHEYPTSRKMLDPASQSYAPI